MSTARVNALHYIGRHDNPASQFSLRAIDPERYQIFNEIDGKVIEEIEESKAFFQVYDGAVYMFQVSSKTLVLHKNLLSVFICVHAFMNVMQCCNIGGFYLS